MVFEKILAKNERVKTKIKKTKMYDIIFDKIILSVNLLIIFTKLFANRYEPKKATTQLKSDNIS